MKGASNTKPVYTNPARDSFTNSELSRADLLFSNFAHGGSSIDGILYPDDIMSST